LAFFQKRQQALVGSTAWSSLTKESAHQPAADFAKNAPADAFADAAFGNGLDISKYFSQCVQEATEGHKNAPLST